MNNKIILDEGLFLNLDWLRGSVPVSAEIMSGPARIGSQDTEDIQVGISGVSWLSQAERKPQRSRGEQGRTGHNKNLHTRIDRDSRVRGARGGPGINITPPPPTRTDREIRVAESEVRERAQVTTPTSPTRRDRDSGAAVSRVGGAQGGPGNNTNLTQQDRQR